MKQITQFEIISHGVVNSQYFQGCGVSFTKYTDVATGIGQSEKEALNDALESLAQNYWDVSTVEDSDDYIQANDEVPKELEDQPEDSDCYFYVSVRVTDEGVSLDFYGNEGKTLFEYAVEQSSRAVAKAEKARTNKGIYEGEAAAWLDRARFINEFFGLRRKVDEKTIERLRASSLEAERKEAKRRAQAEAKARLEQTRAFEAWKRNEKLPDDEPSVFNPSLFPVAFRIEGDELVSSRGARVPVDAAKVALRFVLKHREIGWHRNGSTCEVGYYQLDAINPQGVVAGCHRITWDEVERVATMLA